MSKPYTYLFDHSKPYYNRAERRLVEQDGTTSYLHRSTRHDGLQLTLWDDLGPVGHYDVTDGGDLAQYIDYQRGPVTVTAA